MWHKFPAGRFEDILREALERLLDRIDPDRRLERRQTRSGSNGSAAKTAANPRRIPNRIKDIVWERDKGCCAYVAQDGTRCGEKFGLESDHVLPWAMGGRSDDAGNIRLLCRARNQSTASAAFGKRGRRAKFRIPPSPAGRSRSRTCSRADK